MGAAASVGRLQSDPRESELDDPVSFNPCEITFPQECWFCDQLNVDGGIMSDTINHPRFCCRTCHVQLGLSNSLKKFPWHDGESSALSRNMWQMTVVQTKSSNTECGISICGICRNDFVEKEYALRLSCGHIFHKSCICPWFEHYSSCPTCRYETKSQKDEMMVDELLSNHTEQQLNQRVDALQYLAATVSEIGNIDSCDIYMSHLISGDVASTKFELATKLHLLHTTYFKGTP